MAALLYTFAVTADVVVKAVVDDEGHNANNPIIWIEHKCAGHFGKTTQNQVPPQVVIAVTLTASNQLFQSVPVAQVMAGSPESGLLSPASPPINLRC